MNPVEIDQSIGEILFRIIEIGSYASPEIDTAESWSIITQLRTLKQALAECEQEWQNACGESFGDQFDKSKKTAHLGDVILHRSRPVSKVFDDESLFEAVMDARLVDKETGEIVEETPVHKILHVYGSRRKDDKDGDPRLPGTLAKKGELSKRGINVDDFSTLTFGDGWKVTVKQ